MEVRVSRRVKLVAIFMIILGLSITGISFYNYTPEYNVEHISAFNESETYDNGSFKVNIIDKNESKNIREIYSEEELDNETINTLESLISNNNSSRIDEIEELEANQKFGVRFNNSSKHVYMYKSARVRPPLFMITGYILLIFGIGIFFRKIFSDDKIPDEIEKSSDSEWKYKVVDNKES